MSYHTWHEYGYGIIVDNIHTTHDKVLNLVNLAPKFSQRFNEWINSTGEKLTIELINDFENDDCVIGLTAIMKEVINELEPIEFYACEDFDGTDYLMYIQGYPWYMNEYEKNITTDDIDNILRKYISILTDEDVKIDYQECENGG